MLDPSVIPLIAGLMGAVIGGSVTLGVAILNARSQRKTEKQRFLFEKRLQALESCAEAISERDEIIEAFDVALTQLKVPLSPKNWEQAIALLATLKKWDRARIRFHSRVRVKSIVASATFGLPFPSAYPLHAIALPLLPSSDAGEDERWKTFCEAIEGLKSGLPVAYEKFAKVAESYENYLVECGRVLTTVKESDAAKTWAQYKKQETVNS